MMGTEYNWSFTVRHGQQRLVFGCTITADTVLMSHDDPVMRNTVRQFEAAIMQKLFEVGRLPEDGSYFTVNQERTVMYLGQPLQMSCTATARLAGPVPYSVEHFVVGETVSLRDHPSNLFESWFTQPDNKDDDFSEEL